MFYYIQKKTYAKLNSFQTNFYFFQSPPLISMSIEKPEKKIFFTEKEKQILFTHKHTHTHKKSEYLFHIFFLYAYSFGCATSEYPIGFNPIFLMKY